MLLPVLLAGGSGTRLWPLSRELYPKQLLKLVDERSLLQNTALRARKIPGALPPVVICGERHRFLVAEQLRDAGIAGATLILEPAGRNTAPAAAVAALYAKQHHGGATQVFLMSADHVIRNDRAFVKAAVTAGKAAAQGRLVTFGIKPTRPETGYGYIKKGPPLKSGGGKAGAPLKDVYAVAAFVEKPDARRAAKFIKDRSYSWNGGLFLFTADALIAELKHLEPELLLACEEALAYDREGDLNFIRLDPEAFGRARSVSIDYAVMEKTKNIALVPLDAGWDDVGAWSFLGNLPCDKRGNVTRGDTWLADTDGSLIHAEHRLVAAVGLKDHIVVETRDAVLVAARGQAQQVKDIVTALKRAGRSEADDHPRVYRPWGWYETLTAGGGFQVKRIAVKPGQKLSLQSHRHRAEHWVVVAGTARVTCDQRVFTLAKNQSTFIPLGAKHRLENTGTELLEIVEVQSGDYLGEDDITRYEDVYGRAPK